MSATSVGQIGLDLVVNQKQFNKQMKSLDSVASKMGKKLGKALVAGFSVKKIAEFSQQCIELGSDLQEVENVVSVTFPSMSAKIDKFAKDAAGSFGLSETMAKKYSSTLGSMAKAFGFTEAEAYDMGTTLAGLAGDVASFYNLSQDEAYTKLKSVFTGETESLKDLGVVMTQSALDSYALANGFGKTTNAMSEAEKVALRYAFVQDKLSAAQEDFARTSDSWANQTKVLSLQFESLKANIGQGLIAAFTPVIKVINTLLQKVQVLGTAFKNLMEGIFGAQTTETSALSTAAESAASAAASTADSTGTTAANLQKAEKFLAGFDAINKMSDNSSASSSGGNSSTSSMAIGTASGMDATSNLLENKFSPAFEKTFKKLGKKLDELKKKFSELCKALQEDAQPFVDYITGPFAEMVGSEFNTLWEEHLKPFGENYSDLVGELVNGVAEIYNEFILPLIQFFSQLLEPVIEKFVENTSANIGQMIDVFNGITTSCKGIIQFITGVFTGNWEKAWEGIKNIFKGIFDSLVALVREPVNAIIDCINGMIKGVVKGINTVIKTINSISLKIPDWVPEVGGKKIGFNLKSVTAPEIPKLAGGGFVKKNTPQLAIIGDNRHQGEVVAPEDKLREMAKQAVREAGAGGVTKEELERIVNNAVIRIVAALYELGFNIDGETLAKAEKIVQQGVSRRFNTAEIT